MPAGSCKPEKSMDAPVPFTLLVHSCPVEE